MASYKTVSDNYEDEFVQRVYEGKTGTFLDLGVYHGRHSNNTFVLEEAGWTGLLVGDSRDGMTFNSRFRRQPCAVVADFKQVDWVGFLSKAPGASTGRVDYISWGPTVTSVEVIRRFPWSSVRVGVQTVQWPENMSFDQKLLIRGVLSAAGFTLVAEDVLHETTLQPAGDWWVDAKIVPAAAWEKYKAVGRKPIDILYKSKIPFATVDAWKHQRTRSADLQDEFVARMSPNKKSGRFLDVGSGNGLQGNNTAVLEDAGWSGILVDINREAYDWNRMNRPCSKAVCDDVTICDWDTVVGSTPGASTVFDFISFDVDDATIPAVKRFPWDRILFKVCTIEHDAYQRGPEARLVIRDALSRHGYMLLAADVCADFNLEPYEDWWIDPAAFSPEEYLPYVTAGKRGVEVFMQAR